MNINNYYYPYKSSNIKQSINGIFCTLQQRSIITSINEQELISILTNKNKWTEFDIRKWKHLKFDDKDIFISNYLYAKQLKSDYYFGLKQFTITTKTPCKSNHKKLLRKYNENITITSVITYQKQIIDVKELNNVLNKHNDLLPFNIFDNIQYKINVLYKYQKPIEYCYKWND